MRKLFAFLLLSPVASATEWHVLGARAMGMGGAGVAGSQGPVAAYWNPAALGQESNGWGAQAPVGGRVDFTGPMIEGANDLNKIADDCRVGPTNGSCSQANIDAALNKINSADSGVRGDIGGGATVGIGRLALFVNNFLYLSGKPSAQISAFNTPATIVNNQSKLILRGAQILELGVGYGMELPFAPGVLAGANLKGLVGKAGYYEMLLASEDPGNGALDKFKNNSRSTFQPGVDVGLLWDIARTVPMPARPRLGVTFRNINNPKFDNPDISRNAGQADKFSLEGQGRAGVAISPLPFWHFAADLDLTRNLTGIDGIKSQVAGVGTEINVFNRTWLNIPLRAGLSRNLAYDGAKTAISGGFGLHFLHVHADISGAMSPATQTVQSQGQSQKVPSNFAFAAQAGVLFGGAK